MKLYRVHYSRDDDPNESAGYSWHSSKEAAKKAGRNGAGVRVDAFEFECNKSGVIELLNQVASYPDNG